MAYDFSRYRLTPEQQQRIDTIKSRPTPRSVWGDQAEHDAWNEAIRLDQSNRSKAAHNRLVNVGKVASIAPFALAGGAALAGGGAAASAGGAASVPGAVGASAAPLGVGTVTAGGGGMTLGNLWNLGNLGVGAVSSVMGMRSQNRAANQQYALAEREMAMRAAADAEARAEAKRQFDAQQMNTQRQFAADDEERAYNRRLLEERESRLASRRAYADRARQRLAQFLGLG